MESTENKLVTSATQMITKERIWEDLKVLGVAQGMTLLLHSSLSKLGWVCGGSVAVILALLDVLGSTGTLVMPTHSGDLSDPAKWRNPPVPEEWWGNIYQTMPPYRPDLTPTRAMGAIPETFRKMDGVLRSSHPHFSLSAYGPNAEAVTANHSLAHGMSEASPLARIYDVGGWVLLLGVGHGNNTSLHLAENRADFNGKKLTKNGAPLEVEGKRKWVEFEEIDYQDEDFPQIGKDFAAEGGEEVVGMVGSAEARLMHQPALVDYAVRWIEKNRD